MAEIARISAGYGDCEDCGYYEFWMEIHYSEGSFALRHNNSHLGTSRDPEWKSPEEFDSVLREEVTRHLAFAEEAEDASYDQRDYLSTAESLSPWIDLVARIK